jgi:hypothetical protein
VFLGRETTPERVNSLFADGPCNDEMQAQADRDTVSSNIFGLEVEQVPMLVAARLLGLRVRISPEAWMSVCCECVVR